MTHIPLLCLNSGCQTESQLRASGLEVQLVEQVPNGAAPFVVSGASGGDIEATLRLHHVDLGRVIAVCPTPDGLPSGLLWLSPELLTTEKGRLLLKTWTTSVSVSSSQRLIAQISHDIKSPVAVISDAACLLKTYGNLSGRLAGYVALIERSASSLKGLLNDIRDYAAFQLGEFALFSMEFNLHHLLRSVTDSIRTEVRDPEMLSVSCTYDALVPAWVQGDPGRLRQVLTHLMKNAVKFTEKGTVQLSVSVQDGLISFRVSDTGLGIAEPAQERIFAPYQQADESIRQQYGGVGLGLAICRTVVSRLGGNLGLESRHGQGSVFWFTARLPEVSTHTSTTSREVRGRRIFLGSANPELFVTSLSILNAVLVCSSLEDVENQLGIARYDLYLIDLEVDGFSMVERVLKYSNESPVVVFTSSGQRGDVARCASLGVRGYLTTPIEPEEIEVALALVLDAPSKDVVTKYSAQELLEPAAPRR